MPTNPAAKSNISAGNPTRKARLPLVVLIGLCLIFIVSYAGRLAQKAQLETASAHWQAQIEQAKQQRLGLAVERDYVASPAYVQKTARDELGLAQLGDAIVLVVAAAPTPLAPVIIEVPSAAKTNEPDNWRQWLSLFIPAATSTTR